MTVTETEKEVVVFSSLYIRDYPELYKEISDILFSYHKGYGTVSHTKDYWVRDFMPVQMDTDVFLQFIYNPDYLQAQKQYITDVDKVMAHWPYDHETVKIPLVVDGGNMVFCKGYRNGEETHFLVMTEKVLVENPSFNRQQTEQILRCAFRDTHMTIVWLPWDRLDKCGHTDGIVRCAGVGKGGKPKVLVNLELYDDDIANKMYRALTEHFEVVELQLSEYDELSWAYINSLQTHDFIILPGIGNAVTDAEALAQYRRMFPEYGDNIHQVQMHDFISENGGALNCCTWTYRENILHTLNRGAQAHLDNDLITCLASKIWSDFRKNQVTPNGKQSESS